MANTYSQIYIQVVFAVKGRENLVHTKWKEELYKYICGIVNGKNQKVYAINGMPDHIHILLSIKPDISLSDLIRDVKANSSKWINTKSFVKGKFQWQEGFGAFSYSQSQLDNVITYINNQEEHHLKKTFKQEYIALLDNFKIEFEEKYVFEWIE
ncbi:MAG: IS200/IS605 family transposase [Bacteroidia bacterium]